MHGPTHVDSIYIYISEQIHFKLVYDVDSSEEAVRSAGS